MDTFSSFDTYQIWGLKEEGINDASVCHFEPAYGRIVEPEIEIKTQKGDQFEIKDAKI